jgi:hypothetical protein
MATVLEKVCASRPKHLLDLRYLSLETDSGSDEALSADERGVQNAVKSRMLSPINVRLQHCDEALIASGSATVKARPQEPPTRRS